MFGRLLNLPGYHEFRLKNCILIVEFLQILSFCKETFYFEKNLCMQKLYFVMRKDFMYFFVLRMSAMCVFGRHRHLSGEFASFVLIFLFISCVGYCHSEVFGKALLENAFKVSFVLVVKIFSLELTKNFAPV